MQRTPTVSVLMPVRYGPEFVAEAANSILAQSFQDFEFIIVDDGAPAACKALLSEIARADPRVILHATPRSGLVNALNEGLRIARGKLVARMDADDVSLPARLETQLRAMEEQPALAVIGSNYSEIDQNGATLRTVILPASSAAIRETLATSNCLCHPSVMMRKDAIVAVGGYRHLRGCEDFDLWRRIGERHDLANLQQPLLLYRRHAGQATWSALEDRILSEVAVEVSAGLRARGDPDLPLDAEGACADILERAGLSKPAVQQAMRVRALVSAMHAINGDDDIRARAALAVARRHGAMWSREMQRYWKLMVKLQLAMLRRVAASLTASRSGRP
jgi:glycosyltransferase involved in cell wall biosynthesis